MTLVDDDEVEEVRPEEFAEALLVVLAEELLVEREVDLVRCDRRAVVGRVVDLVDDTGERPEILLTLPFAGTIWKDTVKLAAKKLEKSEVFYKTFNTFCLDCGTIDFESLCVRTRRTGDTLRLTENGGSRSLKKLMIDRKIPRYMRNAMAVIADKNGVIAVQDIGADCSRTAKNNANTLQITVKGLSKNGL